MSNSCYALSGRKMYTKTESNGWRNTFYYPGAGTYSGCWLKSQHHLYGVKESKKNLIYDGQWRNGKRHGYGTMRRRLEDGTMERTYVGEWFDDLKSGEGKQFFANGVYYGWWKDNRRNGLGIKWYKNGDIYMGEWQSDTRHGLGVFLYANGNRYEGYFARGRKNGEGTYYHILTGQVQKGMWDNDICKVSIIQDEYRQQAVQPSPYPIPKLKIENPNKVIRELFAKYKNNANKPSKSLEELICINFARKMKQFAKFEPKHSTNSKLLLDDLSYSCTCRKPEKFVTLQEL